jgi:hypothetical protein
MSPDLQPVVSIAVVLLLAWALTSLRAWRRRLLRRRSTPRQPETVIERHIAAGSLAGVAPADIQAYVLVVLDEDGRATVTGTGCGSLRAFLLAHAAAAHAHAAWQAHDCGHGGAE